VDEHISMIDPGFALIVFFGIMLLLAVLLWSRVGVVPRLLRLARLDERVRFEDALKHVFTCQQSGQMSSLESLAGRLEISTGQAASLLSRLTEMGLVQMEGDGPTLTTDGAQTAVRIVRTHRLWERYLADRTGVPPVEWHDQAERMEHTLSAEEVDRLESRLGHPSWDPHGDPIPTSDGEIPPVSGIGLLSADVGRMVEIVHLEDEPREIYETLLKDGLVLGRRIEIVARTDRGVRVRTGGREWTLDPVVARNISVRQLPSGECAEPERITLLDARLNETVRVVEISGACQGTQRRRLLDLGVVRGTEISPELVSAAGDPVAYRIRGALIALRETQASWIAVDRLDKPEAIEEA
jgi:DtxR family Mn-dependent transcriptional regulator